MVVLPISAERFKRDLATRQFGTLGAAGGAARAGSISTGGSSSSSSSSAGRGATSPGSLAGSSSSSSSSSSSGGARGGGGISSGGSSSSSSSSGGKGSTGSGSSSSGSGSKSSGGSTSSGSSSSGKGSTSGIGKGATWSSGGSKGLPKSSPPGYTSGSGASFPSGGSARKIPSSAVFSGREFGGGTRSSIYQGNGYGGGYPGTYASGGSAAAKGAVLGGTVGLGYGYVAGMGFPYGYWPLYIGPHYYSNDEYGPYSNSSRPGGALTVSSLSPASSNASSSPPQYLVFGDASSVSNVTAALSSRCAAAIVVGTTPVKDDGTYASSPMASSNQSAPLLPGLNPQNVLSYYRSSSFALYSFFDNQPTNPNSTVNYTSPASQPAPFLYPSSARNTSFESCLNSTIADALPIEQGKLYTSGAAKARMAGEQGRMALFAAVGAMCVLGGVRWQVAMLLVAVLIALQA
ncbi:hypothetical protein JCM8097_005572 [Rhodosporidiobolus ruineniae]